MRKARVGEGAGPAPTGVFESGGGHRTMLVQEQRYVGIRVFEAGAPDMKEGGRVRGTKGVDEAGSPVWEWSKRSRRSDEIGRRGAQAGRGGGKGEQFEEPGRGQRAARRSRKAW